ncbi:HTH-10 family transcription regulator [Natrialba magadii ATCC 43099]|uniref:Bacterio-opsin activator HTH domain-containing protein n=1 Tax=Natrialba magadii (strain ATCC 43099 / DSM 3394 / CCM 3739 / CIP 104546 / IAM 13178 / JCM 8861 / NBRC 102185 / NCIMB 2190 / MS3) TaxID=547559 RepID=D3SQQ3_NATMM|nr:helix-turn-helix domain-containing protein [Natrialba magadii]ADD04541.1 HTH-10 family transcription regulator [Natrialba magadii ATCC 43099]ELY25198.1 bacterio-opsin activator HTH domain-containing protein [Natrialba magadii ATCC 43099]
MKYLDVCLSQPDWMLHPMQRFIRDTDAVRYEELQAWNVDARDPTLEYELFYVEADREPYETALESVDSIRWYDLTTVDDDAFYLYVCQETRDEDVRWREALTALDLVIVPPIAYDSTAAFSVTVVGTSENLQTMLEMLPDEIDVAVRAIGEYDRRHAPLVADLTDRQLEAITTAVDAGYFEVPREAGVAEVADELGCASSTASRLLQKAQARVMRRLVRRYGRKWSINGSSIRSL